MPPPDAELATVKKREQNEPKAARKPDPSPPAQKKVAHGLILACGSAPSGTLTM